MITIESTAAVALDAAHDYYGEPGIRRLCHLVKGSPDPDERVLAEKIIAYDLSDRVRNIRNAVLVPAPQHDGRAEYTLAIAEFISERTRIPVADVLERKPGETIYESKKRGGNPKPPEMFLNGPLPDADRYLFVDTVFATGRTWMAACEAAGIRLVPLVYAYDNTAKLYVPAGKGKAGKEKRKRRQRHG